MWAKRIADRIELIDRIEVKVRPYSPKYHGVSTTPLYHIRQYLAMYITDNYFAKLIFWFRDLLMKFSALRLQRGTHRTRF